MTQAADTLFDDVLERVMALVLDTAGMQSASKRLFEHPGKGPFPRGVVYYGPITPNYITNDYVRYTAVVTVRLFGGPVAAGAIGESEDRLNQMLMALYNRLHRAPMLEAPDTREAFRYLTGNLRFRQSSGTQGFVYGDPNNPDRYFGTDIPFEIELHTPKR